MKTVLIAADLCGQEQENLVQGLQNRYELLLARTGGQILDTFRICPVDAIIISLNLCGFDSIFTIRTIRQINAQIPIILFSDFINLNALRLAAEAGLSEILQTPINVQTLEEVLQKHLSEKENQTLNENSY